MTLADIHAVVILPKSGGKTTHVLTWTDDLLEAIRKANKFPDAAQPSGASCGQSVNPPSPAGPLAEATTDTASHAVKAASTAASVRKESTP